MIDPAATNPPEDEGDEDLGHWLLEVLPGDGSSLGNLSAREALGQAAGAEVSEEAYEEVKERLLAMGLIRKGRGRGGAIALATAPATSATNGHRARKEAPAKDFKAVLWASADKLRAQMDAAEYKHLVLGLIFLKYISDTFAAHRPEVMVMVSDPDSDNYIGDDPTDHEAALEDCDYYTQENVFWVPADARWESLRARAKQPDVGQLIDKALVAIENENLTLRGKLDKRFGAAQLEPGRLGELVDLISTIGFADEHRSGDVLGEVYEYFLGQFSSAEGKKGGQFYTPAHVVKTLVAVLAPHKGRIYDPCCGSGGIFVQSEKFIQAHGGKRDDASIYGQESNPTTWRLAAMNLAIRGFAADLGQEPADTFARDQFPDQKFDTILANPPFNISDWDGRPPKDVDGALQQLLSGALVADGITDVFKLAGLNKPDLSILSEEFLQEINKLPQKNLAVELLRRLLQDELQSRFRTNWVKQKRFSELLQASLAKYANRSVEAAQVIEELIAMAREFRLAAEQAKNRGLNPAEEAFYDSLANNASAQELMGDEVLMKMARELADKLRGNLTIDWQYKDNVRARLRTMIKALLKRYKYPPDEEKAAIDLVLQQTELLSEEWSREDLGNKIQSTVADALARGINQP